MDQLTFNDLRWCIEEADYRTLERFCKRTQDPKLNANKIRRCIEAYILERFDNVARSFLTRVKDFRDIEHYAATLDSWCDDILPGLERQFRPVDSGKLARRIAHWKAEAISRARNTGPDCRPVHRAPADLKAEQDLRKNAQLEVAGSPLGRHCSAHGISESEEPSGQAVPQAGPSRAPEIRLDSKSDERWKALAAARRKDDSRTTKKPVRRNGESPKKGGRPVILVDGERIKELRGERSQAAFAIYCNLSVDTIQRAEGLGRSSNKTIRKIVNVLKKKGEKVEPEDLIIIDTIINTPQ